MGRPLGIGVAGLGNAGYQVLPHIELTPGVRLAAAADVREEALASFGANHSGIPAFRSVKAMCEESDVDAVWVATPNSCHAEHAVQAAHSGKHVICEKPMALTLEECDRMIEAAVKNSTSLLMHSKANEPPVAAMREWVASGRLGRPIQINTWNYKGWLRSARLPSEVDTSQGGGVVFRQGAHQVDIVRSIGGGRIKRIRAAAGKWNPDFDTEGDFTAFVEFEDGTAATLVFNGYGYLDVSELTWGIGESGFEEAKKVKAPKPMAAGPVDPTTRYAMPRRAETRQREGERRQPFFGLTLVSCERGDIRQSPDGLYVYSAEGLKEITCPPFLDRGIELQKLTEAVGGTGHVFTDGRWGKATLEAILAILQSSREGREITLSHQVDCP